MSEAMRGVPATVLIKAADVIRFNRLKDDLRKEGKSMESFLGQAVIAECESRGLVAAKSAQTQAEEAIAAGDDQLAAAILLSEMKAKLEAKAKAEADRKAILDKAKEAAAKKPGKKAAKP